jgi:hypothetical protein
LVETIEIAAALSDTRVLLQSSWTDMSRKAVEGSTKGAAASSVGEASSDGSGSGRVMVFPVGPAPHDWLFPHVEAVVHHGGAGTVAAGLRAGKPTLICPFFGDQYFWAQALQRAKVRRHWDRGHHAEGVSWDRRSACDVSSRTAVAAARFVSRWA